MHNHSIPFILSCLAFDRGGLVVLIMHRCFWRFPWNVPARCSWHKEREKAQEGFQPKFQQCIQRWWLPVFEVYLCFMKWPVHIIWWMYCDEKFTITLYKNNSTNTEPTKKQNTLHEFAPYIIIPGCFEALFILWVSLAVLRLPLTSHMIVQPWTLCLVFSVLELVQPGLAKTLPQKDHTAAATSWINKAANTTSSAAMVNVSILGTASERVTACAFPCNILQCSWAKLYLSFAAAAMFVVQCSGC